MKERKGIILAGGNATRLYPLTISISKQLLPVYSKPMIYYPLSLLMLAGIKHIIIITQAHNFGAFYKLLEFGNDLGINIDYVEQNTARGLPEAYILAKDFLQDHPSCMILGDNIMYGNDLSVMLKKLNRNKKSSILAYHVKDPSRYGIIDVKDGKILSIEEKPKKPKSNYAIPGLYFFDENAPKYAEELKPSKRGELEITDLLKKYLSLDNLNVEICGRGIAWFDAGTHQSLLDASNFVATIEERQGTQIANLKEIAKYNGWVC